MQPVRPHVHLSVWLYTCLSICTSVFQFACLYLSIGSVSCMPVFIMCVLFIWKSHCSCHILNMFCNIVTVENHCNIFSLKMNVPRPDLTLHSNREFTRQYTRWNSNCKALFFSHCTNKIRFIHCSFDMYTFAEFIYVEVCVYLCPLRITGSTV